jgi:hypothetical protein
MPGASGGNITKIGYRCPAGSGPFQVMWLRNVLWLWGPGTPTFVCDNVVTSHDLIAAGCLLFVPDMAAVYGLVIARHSTSFQTHSTSNGNSTLRQLTFGNLLSQDCTQRTSFKQAGEHRNDIYNRAEYKYEPIPSCPVL